MADIIERLLKYRPADEWGEPVHHTICDEAALEIERLRNKVLCSDCPRVGYPTDETRCLPCPRRDQTDSQDQGLAEFTAYFVRNYPGPDTIIFDPKWHAPKIFAAARRAMKEVSTSPAHLDQHGQGGDE